MLPRHIGAVAYQTLGSASEADDAVQEAWLRLSRTDPDNIENLGGWLTTVVARVCLNMLQARRDEPVGMRLPETAVSDADGIDPETEALLADSIGPALLVIKAGRSHSWRSRSPARRSLRSTSSTTPAASPKLTWPSSAADALIASARAISNTHQPSACNDRR
jgi:DNA-directed RNA polymerase specialized sigma24 family protein